MSNKKNLTIKHSCTHTLQSVGIQSLIFEFHYHCRQRVSIFKRQIHFIINQNQRNEGAKSNDPHPPLTSTFSPH